MSWPNDKGVSYIRGFVVDELHGAIPPDFFSIVKAWYKNEAPILVITHRLTRQETSDNQTVAFWVHLPVKYEEFDHNTWKYAVNFMQVCIWEIAKIVEIKTFYFRVGRELGNE